jgi:hypothetical protein
MPIIITKKSGACSACGGRIIKGEYVHFEAATGTRHVECGDQPATQRRNAKRAACAAPS